MAAGTHTTFSAVFDERCHISIEIWGIPFLAKECRVGNAPAFIPVAFGPFEMRLKSGLNDTRELLGSQDVVKAMRSVPTVRHCAKYRTVSSDNR